MNLLEQLLQKQEEFQAFVRGIDANELAAHSRAELQQYLKKEREIEERHIHSEIYQLIEQKKFEEYPELLGVHHFPELKEIDFLTEEQLITLDKKLATRPLRQVVDFNGTHAPWRYHGQIKEFLVEKGIVTRYIHALCPNCCENTRISGSFDEKHKQQWLADLKASNEACEAVGLLKQSEFSLDGYCEGCGECYIVEDGNLTEEFIKNLSFGSFLIMAKERDKRWDHI